MLGLSSPVVVGPSTESFAMLRRILGPARLSSPCGMTELIRARVLVEFAVLVSYVAATDTTATTTSLLIPTVEVKAKKLLLTMPYDFEAITGIGPVGTQVGVLGFKRIFSNGMHKTLGLDEARRPDDLEVPFTLTYAWSEHGTKPLLQKLQERVPWSGVDEDSWLAKFLVMDRDCRTIDLTTKPEIGSSRFPVKVVYPKQHDITALNDYTPRYATQITVRETADVAANYTVGRLITVGEIHTEGGHIYPKINTIIAVSAPFIDPTNVLPSTRTITLGTPLEISSGLPARKCDPVMIKTTNRVVVERIRKAVLKVPAKPDEEGLRGITVDWTQNLVTDVKQNSFFDQGNVTKGMFFFQIIDAAGDVFPCTQSLLMQYIDGSAQSSSSFDIIFATMKAASDDKKVGTVVEYSLIDPPFGWRPPVVTSHEARLRLMSLLDEGSRDAWKPPLRQYVLDSKVRLVAEVSVRVHEGQFDGTSPMEAQSLFGTYTVPKGCGSSCYGGYTYEGVRLLGGCAEHLTVSPGEDHQGTPWCMVVVSCEDSKTGFGGDWVLCEKTDGSDSSQRRNNSRTSFARGMMAPSRFATGLLVTAPLLAFFSRAALPA